MDAKSLVIEQVVREREYLNNQEVGTKEYNDSMSRLMVYEKELAELERTESDAIRKTEQYTDEKKDRLVKNIIEGLKVGVGVAMPLIGLVWITATETEHTFRGTLKEYTRYFMPKKLF